MTTNPPTTQQVLAAQKKVEVLLDRYRAADAALLDAIAEREELIENHPALYHPEPGAPWCEGYTMIDSVPHKVIVQPNGRVNVEKLEFVS